MLASLERGAEERHMRELTTLELKAVAGGAMAPPVQRRRHPLLRLIVGLIILALRRKQPNPKLEAA